MKQPNIVFILSDQQRWDSVGVYGQKLDVSPNIDRMATQGVRFANAFTCQPTCGPARSCLQTGRFATETGCFINGIALPEDEMTMPCYLKEAGYDVAYVGKWHLASDNREYHQQAIPLKRRGGFDGYWVAADLPEYVSSGYAGKLFDQSGEEVWFQAFRADAYTDLAFQYLDRRPEGRPFFLFLSYVEPHPQPYHPLYKGPEPDDRRGILRDYLRYDGPKDYYARFAEYDIPGDLIGTRGDWEESYTPYLASCARVDWNVGRLLDKLEDLGIAEETLVVYTSDHSCHFRTRNLTDGKCSCHDNSIRIPLIIRGPGFSNGESVQRLASLIDLPPTLLRAAGMDVPAGMRGHSLQDAIAPDNPDWPDSVFAQISSAEVGRAVRTMRWKYAISALHKKPRVDSGSDEYLESHLYDLQADPHERHNLVSDPALDGIRSELRSKLVQWMDIAGEAAPGIRPHVND